MTGFLLVDKPEGMTSFDLVRKIRRLTGEKKCGHSGTLDPLATGVMIIACGACTRFLELLPENTKEYTAKFKLGERTDTLDISGEVVGRSDIKCTQEQLKTALNAFKGEVRQIPPMYSAVKVGGRRLYELAREGQEIERKERIVSIYALDLISFDEEKQIGKIHVSCSAGTYVRTLIDDVGEKLGSFAVMTALRRTAAHGVGIDECVSLGGLEGLGQAQELESILVPPQKLLNYDKISITEKQAKRFLNGGELDFDRIKGLCGGKMYSVFSPEGKFCGIGKADEHKGQLTVQRVYTESK